MSTQPRRFLALALVLGAALLAPLSAQTYRGFAVGELGRTLVYDDSGALIKTIAGSGFNTVVRLPFLSRFMVSDDRGTIFYDMRGNEVSRALKTTTSWQWAELFDGIVLVTDGDRVRLYGTDGIQHGQDVMRVGAGRQDAEAAYGLVYVTNDIQVQVLNYAGSMLFQVNNTGGSRQAVKNNPNLVVTVDANAVKVHDRSGGLKFEVRDRGQGPVTAEVHGDRVIVTDDRGVRIYDESGTLKRSIDTVGRADVTLGPGGRIVITDDLNTTVYDQNGTPTASAPVNKDIGTARQKVQIGDDERIIVIGDRDVVVLDKNGSQTARVPTSGRADVETTDDRVIITDDNETGIYEDNGSLKGPKVRRTGMTRQKVKVNKKGDRITVIDDNGVGIFDKNGILQGSKIPMTQSHESFVQPFDQAIAIRDLQASRLRFYGWDGQQLGQTFTSATSFIPVQNSGGLWALGELRRLQLLDATFRLLTAITTSGSPIAVPLCFPLMSADTDVVDVATGGQQRFWIDAGGAQAGSLYLILGSMSGTSPGLPLGSLVMPLAIDPYFLFLLQAPNLLVQGSLGALDSNGQAQAAFVLPPEVFFALLGLQMHHACLVVNPLEGSFEMVSGPVALNPVF